MTTCGEKSEIKNGFTNIEWSQIVGMRHILIHEYFGVDDNLVWQVIRDDIPKLKAAIGRVSTDGEKEGKE